MTAHELARKHDVVVVTVTPLNALGYLYLAGLPGTARVRRTSNSGCATSSLALVGPRQHRGIRRQPGQRDGLRPVGRRRQDLDADAMPAAKGLFHRAIIMSTLADTAITGLQPARAIEAAELCHSGSASRPAARGTAAQRLVERRPARGRRTGPTRYLAALYAGRRRPDVPRPPVRAAASDLSAAVPIRCGSNESEGVPTATRTTRIGPRSPLTTRALRAARERIVPVDDQEAERLIHCIGRIARAPRGDLAAIMAGDSCRCGNLPTRLPAEVRAGQGAGVLYHFNWPSPVRNGKLRAMHSDGAAVRLRSR